MQSLRIKKYKINLLLGSIWHPHKKEKVLLDIYILWTKTFCFLAVLSSRGNFISSVFSIVEILKFFSSLSFTHIHTKIYSYILNNYYKLNLKLEPILQG